MQIGFFDSGIGGITVLHDALRMLPNEDYIYYADTIHVPYGSKPKSIVKRHVLKAAEFIVQKGVKALVIACNTATSVAIEDLRKRYSIPIIGMEPAVKPAIASNTKKRILVTATTLTLKEEKLKNLISSLDRKDRVDLLPLPNLVQFAENADFDAQIVLPYLTKELNAFDLSQYETIVLGCTHFIYYKNVLKKMLPPDINIIDGNTGTVKNLKHILEKKRMCNEGSGKITYFHSGIEVRDQKMLDQYRDLLNRLDVIDL